MRPKTTETISQQCARRVIERNTFKSLGEKFAKRAASKARKDSKAINALVVDFSNRCVDQAVTRLPVNASWELRRQVIREAKS